MEIRFQEIYKMAWRPDLNREPPLVDEEPEAAPHDEVHYVSEFYCNIFGVLCRRGYDGFMWN